MSTIQQWVQAANRYLDSQEASNHAKKNREIVMKRFSDLTNKKVLELGCGYGWYTYYFNSIHADAIGVDGFSSMIKLAKEKYFTSIYI
ncbi:class I SAM-dependent methyltransferase [Traorella massiliensis]|uniref:class I SAM-dependent methyltransferase n=1 Tax=Traorella massiliensis TaxID=1903263 RepID=UPI0008F835CB|nr:methyltransferase domain-containing protein [Traorella massiliensis]